MPYFVVSCTDAENSLEQRLAVRPRHVARLQQLYAEGRLLMAGPMPKDPNNLQDGFYGSTLIVEFEHRAALDEWLAAEPFWLEGVYSHIDVKPFMKTFPQE